MYCVVYTRQTRRAGLRRRLAKSGLTLRGENITFSEKNDQKGSQNRVSVYHSLVGDIEVFSSFQGFLKIQVEMTRAGKGGEVAHMLPGRVNTDRTTDGRTCKHTRAV